MSSAPCPYPIVQGYKFEQPMEPPPPQVDDEIRRREEEELQRALEISVQDKGGRGHWSGYTPSAAAAGSSASLTNQQPSSATSSSRHAQTMSGYTPGPGPTSHASHTSHSTARAASPVREPQPSVTTQAPAYTQTHVPAYSPTIATVTATTAPSVSPQSPTVVTINPASSPAPVSAPAPAPSLDTTSRVRALHNFEPADSGELAFEKGDVIKVVDRTHKDWWRGQLKGRTGIFPVNYVVRSSSSSQSRWTISK
jgi:signal transducing adaptor molecule